ncbi:MAG: type IV pilus secretin PilQ, partial [Nitrospira sp.]|nr:type IV pilus secretin PilQ [Nitrospira sp.]
VMKPMNTDQRLFTMEFRDAEIKDVLRAIGQEHRLNIIVSDDVSGKLTLSFQKVTLQEAIDAILRVQNLIAFQDGDILRVVKSPFGEGEELLVTRMIPINFATVKETSETVKSLLSKKGSLSMDTRTNTLLVRDVPGNVERILEIVKKLDSKTPQVMIEARIVEVNTNFTRDLGVQWGVRNTRPVSDTKFISYGAGGTRQDSTSTEITSLSGAVGISGKSFAVNLPAAVGPGVGGAFDLSYGTLAGTLGLDLQLSALEDTGRGKILSNPRILTLDNKEATISTGTEILIPTTTIVTGVSTGSSSSGGGGSATSGVTTIDAKLELAVTPHVTADGHVLMHVKTDKKDPDFGRAVQGVPPLTTRSAVTDLLVKDGETIVIGGIYTRNEGTTVNAIPWFNHIPILGWLFKKEIKVDNQTELLIFITPTVYK